MNEKPKSLLEVSCFSAVPFHPVPRENMAIWAGSTSVRDELLRIVNDVKHEGMELSHLALLYGEYGSGKTHALKFLKAKLEEQQNVVVAYLAKPKVESKGTFLGIAKEVIKQIGKNPLSEAVKPIVEYISKESKRRAVEEMGNMPDGDDPTKYVADKTAVFKRELQEELYDPFPEIFNIFEGLVKGDSTAWNYFAGKPTPTALAAYDLNSPIDDDHDAFKALAAVYNILTTGYPAISGTPVYDAAYLFIDEMEQFLEIRTEEILSIRTGLRDIFNSCTEHFCLILSATAENASLFHPLLEEAIMVRVTAEPVHISSHDEIEDGTEFIAELMDHYRGPEQPPHRYFPFSENALKRIVERTGPPKTARKLISNCRRVWDSCAEIILAGSEISEEDVEDVHGLL